MKQGLTVTTGRRCEPRLLGARLRATQFRCLNALEWVRCGEGSSKSGVWTPDHNPPVGGRTCGTWFVRLIDKAPVGSSIVASNFFFFLPRSPRLFSSAPGKSTLQLFFTLSLSQHIIVNLGLFGTRGLEPVHELPLHTREILLLVHQLDSASTMSLLPVALYGLEVPPGETLVPAAIEFPATVSSPSIVPRN